MSTKARAEMRHPERNGKLIGDVMISYVRDDWTVGMFTDMLVDTVLADADKRIGLRFSVATSRYVDARNDIIRRFLDSHCQWLWMLDVDMTFHPSTLFNMLAVCEANPEVRILGGLCFVGGRHWGLEPTIYAENLNSPGDYYSVYDYPKNALLEVGRTGAATLLMHRDALEMIQKEHGDKAYPWFADEDRGGGSKPGEDMVFCERARAAGFGIYVHTGIRFGHMKMSPLFEWEFDHQQTLNPAERALAEREFNRSLGLEP